MLVLSLPTWHKLSPKNWHTLTPFNLNWSVLRVTSEGAYNVLLYKIMESAVKQICWPWKCCSEFILIWISRTQPALQNKGTNHYQALQCSVCPSDQSLMYTWAQIGKGMPSLSCIRHAFFWPVKLPTWDPSANVLRRYCRWLQPVFCQKAYRGRNTQSAWSHVSHMTLQRRNYVIQDVDSKNWICPSSAFLLQHLLRNLLRNASSILHARTSAQVNQTHQNASQRCNAR